MSISDEGILGGLFAFFAGIMIFVIILGIAFLVFYFIGMFKMLKKAGKGGWECLIPFYSTYVLTEIAGLNWWWFLIVECSSISALFVDNSSIVSLLSLASLFGRINLFYNLSKKFHKETGWIVLSVFFGGITMPVLGYSSKDYYDYNIPVTKNGFIDSNKGNNQQPNMNQYGQPQYNQQTQSIYGQPVQPQPVQPQEPVQNQDTNINGEV